MSFGQQKRHGEARWQDVNWTECVEVLAACADSGALVSLGRSRDGGALSVGYVNGGKKDRDWVSSPDDVPEMLYELHKILCPGSPVAEAPASAPPAGDPPVARRGRARAT